MPSARLTVGALPRALGLVGDFSCDWMLWDERGGGPTPVGSQVDTSTIKKKVLRTNRVNSRSLDQDIGRSGVHIRA